MAVYLYFIFYMHFFHFLLNTAFIPDLVLDFVCVIFSYIFIMFMFVTVIVVSFVFRISTNYLYCLFHVSVFGIQSTPNLNS